MDKIVLILDLDGVLITTPSWKPDEIHIDGYSCFNTTCAKNLNSLLQVANFEIWLSSSRRKTKTLEEFNAIFRNRGIEYTISGFLPIHPDRLSRKDEIELFIEQQSFTNYLIIDDDKSLHDFHEKKKLILTEYMKGFTERELMEAIQKVMELNIGGAK